MIGFIEKRRNFFNFFVLFLWCSFIFLASSISGSSTQSVNWIIFIERKVAHIMEYSVLAFLCMKFLGSFLNNRKFDIRSIAIIFSFIFASLDEIHQIFVFGRNGRPLDLFIDLLGILIGVQIYIYFKNKKFFQE